MPGFTSSACGGRSPRSSSKRRSIRTCEVCYLPRKRRCHAGPRDRGDPHRLYGVKGFASCSVCNASKAAVRSFARTWIVDLKGRDIRVNVLSPGYTDTPGMSHFMTNEEKAGAVATVPLGRMGTPDDLGKAAAFLVSDDSAYITGIELF